MQNNHYAPNFAAKNLINVLIGLLCLGLSFGVFMMGVGYFKHYEHYTHTGKQALGKIISKEEIMPIPGHLWQEMTFEYNVDGNVYRSKIQQPLKKSLSYKVGEEVPVYFLQGEKGNVEEPTFESPEELLKNGFNSFFIAFIFLAGAVFIAKKGVFKR
jgi:hypothetical protein